MMGQHDKNVVLQKEENHQGCESKIIDRHNCFSPQRAEK